MQALESMFGSMGRRPQDGSGEKDLDLAELAESANRSLEVGPSNSSSRLKDILDFLR